MRLSYLMLAVVIGAVTFSGRADAQNYPWCAQYGGRQDGALNCGFVSFEQCMATAFGAGAFCIRNNRYEPPPGPPRRVHKPRAHKSS